MPRSAAVAVFALLVSFMLTGCAAQSTTPDNSREDKRASQQALRVPEHDHWGDLRDTKVTFDYVRLFGSEPAAPLQIVIHVTGKLGEIGQVSSDTVTWVTNPAAETPQYANVSIITRDRYAYNASEATLSSRAYWPVDVNDDGIDDLLVLGWRHGEETASVQDDQGIWQTRRVSVDEPTELRLITRGPKGEQALAITSDRTLPWPDVLDKGGRFVPMLEQALTQADELIWQERLQRLIEHLSEDSASS